MRIHIQRISVILLAAGAMLWGQPTPAQHGRGPDNGPMPPGPGRGIPGVPPGKWWDNPEMVKKLGLTADQQKKMDDVFQQNRLRLIDLHASLEREEAMLEPLMKAPQLDDAKVLPQIDKIAQARAELEKANARLLVGVRHVLTPEQWQTLQKETPRPRHEMMGPGPQGPPPPPRAVRMATRNVNSRSPAGRKNSGRPSCVTARKIA